MPNAIPRCPSRPEIQDLLIKDFAEALRTGAQGMVDDMAANHGRPWGFPLQEIETNVLFWFGQLDRGVPPAMGEYLSRVVPNAEATFVPDAGVIFVSDLYSPNPNAPSAGPGGADDQ